MNLEPRQVEISDIPMWFRESVALFRRGWIFFLGLSAFYHFLAFILSEHSILSIMLTPLVCLAGLSMGILKARAVDRGEMVAADQYFRCIRRQIIQIGFLALTVILVFTVILTFLMRFDDPAAAQGEVQIPWIVILWCIPGFMIHIYSIVVVYSAMTGWLVNALLTFHKLSTLEALRLSRRAAEINVAALVLTVVMPILVLTVGFYFFDFVALLSALVFPFASIFQYVVYRHIFLGQKENKPVLATSKRVATQEAT